MRLIQFDSEKALNGARLAMRDKREVINFRHSMGSTDRFVFEHGEQSFICYGDGRTSIYCDSDSDLFLVDEN